MRVKLNANKKITAYWNIAPCSLVEVDRRFRGAYCLHHQGDEINTIAEFWVFRDPRYQQIIFGSKLWILIHGSQNSILKL
jgi:hypothetical protein